MVDTHEPVRTEVRRPRRADRRAAQRRRRRQPRRRFFIAVAVLLLVLTAVGVAAIARRGPGIGLPSGEGDATRAAGSTSAEITDMTPASDRDSAILEDARRGLRALPAEWPIVRGVYSTMWSFAGPRWNYLMDLVRTTELNSLVIDVKDDDGQLAWRGSSVALARAAGADRATELTRQQAAARIRELREAGGYPIARVVCFKDRILAPAKPDLAIGAAGGGVWRDRKGMAWLDANNRATWEYIVDIGREAAAMGFLEIQFDYVRFPTDGNVATAVYANGGGVNPAAIRGFLAYAREELHKAGVRVSADIFGLTTYKLQGQGDGDGTGQLFEDVISEVDYVSPMVYPSHYYAGNYGLSKPEANPYEVVSRAMDEGMGRIDGYRARMRPWLEDFSLSVPHHPGRVSAQLRAAYEQGVDSWLLWNAGNRYSVPALEPVLRSKAKPRPPSPPPVEPPPAEEAPAAQPEPGPESRP
ncbi:MAG: putative glycoside hydrolase [Actinomycetota bacterium]|nr:putative glycoside hydrolase [Actinomycetota bacterium]